MGQQLRGPNGAITWVDDDHLSQALDNGYAPVSDPEAGDVATARDTSGAEGALGGIGAAATSIASGATLGGSDYLLKGVLTHGGMREVSDERDAHPIISTIGNVAGAILPAVLTGGASAEASGAELAAELGGEGGLLASTPAALVSRAGTAIVDLGEGAGFAGRTLAKTAAGAAEGAAYGAGGYIADTALGNKDLSADGFTAAMGQGALWGGVAGGALSVTGDMLSNARKLFPKEELTREAVDAATKDATDHISYALDDADAMHLAAKRALREMRDVEVAQNPILGDQLESVAQQHLAENPDGVGLEDAVNREHAKSNPHVDQIVRTGQELAETKSAVKQWFGEEPALARSSADVPKSWDPTQPLDIAIDDLPAHGAAPAPTGVDPIERLAKVFGRSKDINIDIEKAADVITRHEAAAADMVEALGPAAPPRAQEAAAAFRAAQQSAEQRTAQSTVQAAQDVAKAAPHIDAGMPGPRADEYLNPGSKVGDIVNPQFKKMPAKSAAAEPSKAKGLVGMLANIGTGAEALRMMGIDVPDPSHIPVIGPVLGMVLKARLLGKAFGRFGGKVAETAETTIASKHADTMNRMAAAIDSVFEGKGGKIAATGGGAAGTLGHKLFDAGPPQATPYSSDAKESSTLEAFRARANELVASQAPGAVRDALAARIKTSNPAAFDAIVAAQQRKLDFLYSKLPKPDMAPSPLDGQPFTPCKCDLSAFMRVVKAADDPLSLVEKVAAGGIVTPDEVQAFAVAAPNLYAELQKSALNKAMSGKSDVPPARQKQLSALVGMPLDASSNPALGVFLQQGYAAKGGSLSASPPQPTINPNVNFQDRVSNRLDNG